MPAIVRCPNGCKLQVPVRKLFENFQCPKCSSSLFVAQNQIESFERDRKHILEANLSSDLVEISSADIIYLDGAPADLLVEVVEENEEKSIPEPPPVVDSAVSDAVSDAVFAGETNTYVQPQTPELKPGKPDSIPESSAASEDPNNRTPEPATRSQPLIPQAEQESQGVSNSDRVQSKSRDRDNKPPQPVQTQVTTADPPKDFLLRWFSSPENPGVEHHTQNRWKAYSLGWAMFVIGVILVGPVIYTMMQWIGKDYHMPLGRWSFLLIFFSAIQFLYAFFLFQLPDWSSTRFVSYLMLLMTVMSSFMLAVAFLSQESNNFFNFLQLSVTNKQLVCSWLTVMSIGFGLMSYLCGRTTQIWMEEEKRLGIV